MDARTRRKYLNEYSTAHRDIELTGVAIDILEATSNSQPVIKMLKKRQQKYLSKLDAAAAKLGAPYGA